MNQPEIGGISPFFIVRNAATSLAFYRDSLGFEITFKESEHDFLSVSVVHYL
jgi:catechol 2,3-dioxygenase-like lactoylglutathione lyase family enzyme